jgi:hypothetical protein
MVDVMQRPVSAIVQGGVGIESQPWFRYRIGMGKELLVQLEIAVGGRVPAEAAACLQPFFDGGLRTDALDQSQRLPDTVGEPAHLGDLVAREQVRPSRMTTSLGVLRSCHAAARSIVTTQKSSCARV